MSDDDVYTGIWTQTKSYVTQDVGFSKSEQFNWRRRMGRLRNVLFLACFIQICLQYKGGD